MNEAKKYIIDYLAKLEVPYFSFDHPKTDTLPEKLENDRKAGISDAMHCKNLFLANRSESKFYLLTIPFTKKFRTGADSRKMGSGRLNFASEEKLMQFLHTVPGMVSPLELCFDEKKEIIFAVDSDLLEAERICFHPADDTTTFVFERDDFFEGFLKKSGIDHKVIIKNESEDYQ